MYGLSEDKWIEWKKKRRNTQIAYLLVGLVIGIDCSIVDSTLYLYLKDLIKIKRPDLWFGIVLAAFFVSSTLCGTICGRLIDKTRKMGMYVKFALLIQILGFLVYIIYLQPVCLIVGRMLCGIADPFDSVVTGEIMRIYATEESTKNMLRLSAFYSFGFIIGPGFNFLFQRIDFCIGPLQINYTNFCAIFMSGLLLILLVITHFLIHDCSLEFDLKRYSKQAPPDDIVIKRKQDNGNSVDNNVVISNENIDPPSMVNHDDTRNGHCNESSLSDELNVVVKFKNNANDAQEGETIGDDPESVHITSAANSDVSPSDSTESEVQVKSVDIIKRPDLSLPEEVIPIKVVIKTLLTNIDTLIIFAATFFLMYALTSLTMYIPILIYQTMKWSLQTFSIIILASGVCQIIFLTVMGKYCKSNRSVYIAGLICIFSQIIACGILLCFKLLKRKNSIDILLVVLYMMVNILGWCFDNVLIRVFLGNLVPSSIQSFAETLRGGTCRISMILGSLTAGVMSPWLHIWSAVISGVITLILFAFILRRRNFINPQELSFMNVQFVST